MNNNGFIEIVDVIDADEFSYEITEHFSNMSTMERALLYNAKKTYKNIEEMLYAAAGFMNMLKASVPEHVYQAVLTDEQKTKIAQGALKLMTKKDGTLMANLVDPKTKKIISTISLKDMNISPELTQAMTSYATQMQIAQIAEEIHTVQIAIEEVRQGQEYDRLALAYSCQQKLLQAMHMKNLELKEKALMQIAFDAEDSRNLLMLSQSTNVAFIEQQPEDFLGKLLSDSNPEKIELRMNEIREGLFAINMVSLVEAVAYQEIGECDAARQSLEYYADHLQKTFLDKKGLIQRLDLIDSVPDNYWSNTLPSISNKIKELPYVEKDLLEGERNEK